MKIYRLRSYHPTGMGQASDDPQGSNAPMIIEYDPSVQQNIPFGFEKFADVSFNEIVQ